jgi:hypothetical protein
MLTFAGPHGYPAPPRRAITDSTGGYSFKSLPAARYTLCAQVAASEAAPANSPYIDTCVWGSGQSPITLADGQQLAGIVFTAPKGGWLKVHVDDPDRVVPQGAKGPAPLDPSLQLILRGPDGLFRHASFVSHDASGHNYQIAMPLKTAVALKVSSNAGDVFDKGGKKVEEKDEVTLQAATAGDLGPVNFTMRHK